VLSHVTPPEPVMSASPRQQAMTHVQDTVLSVHRVSQPPVPLPNLLDEELADLPIAPASAPPRPANPVLLHLQRQVQEKFAAEFASFSQAMALDTERLRAQQADLLAGEPAIRDEMARLEAVRNVCHNVAERLRKCVDQAERNIAELRRKGDPEVDELVCSTTIVHNQ
jgi:ESCRT-I complex subunit TSG101